ncbi:MAG TPA: oligosaccharide flippase family protein [Edaphocola sp.]|nr:oligosaccharide flippase family protein [Edaphocola sp.]
MKDRLSNRIMYREATLIFINRLFITLCLVVTTYLFAHRLPQHQYGIYQNFWTQFNTLFAISGLGIASFIFSYTPQKVVQIFKSLSKKRLGVGISLILASAIVFGLMQKNAGLSLVWTSTFLILNTLSLLSDSFLIIFKRFRIMLLINFLYFIGFVALHYYCLSQPYMDFNLLFQLLSGLSLCKVLVSFLIFKNEFGQVSNEHLSDKKHLHLWMHLFVFDLIQIFFSYSDKFIVSLLAPAATSAVYINGTYPIPFIPIIFSAVSSAALMQFNNMEDNHENQISILNRTGRALSTVVFPVFFYFLFFRNEFIVFYFSDKYLASVPIFFVSLFMLPFKAFNFTMLFRKREKGSIINKGAIVDISSLLVFVGPCYYFLGLKGIPLSFVLATLMQAGYYMIYHQKILESKWYHILPIQDWIKKIIIFGGASFFLHWLFIDFMQFSGILSLTLALTIIILIAIAFLFQELNFFSKNKFSKK